jgi:hypothetical protein
MKCPTSFLGVLLAVIGSACSASSEHRTVPAPREDVLRGNETIVLTPVVLPEELEGHEAAAVELDSLIASFLASSGYSLIPADEYTAVWDGILQQMGGIYDFHSGELDNDRFDLARERLFIDLTELYQADAVLYPEVWIVDAPFSEGVAKWDGTSEAMVGFGIRLLDALGAAFSQDAGSQLPVGTVRALSLVVFLEDMSGGEVFSNAGGIQVLEKVGSNPSDIEAVRDGELLVDLERTAEAVDIALAPLVERR